MLRHVAGLRLAAALLLASGHRGSAQILGGLKELAGALKRTSPGQITGALSGRSPEDLASSALAAKGSREAVEALRDTTPAEAAAALQRTRAVREAGQATKAVVQQGQQRAGKALSGRRPKGASGAGRGASAPAPAQAPAQATPAASALPSKPPKGEVAEALHSVRAAVQKAEQALNATSSSRTRGALDGTAAQKAADALKGAVPKSLPEALNPESLQRAKGGLEGAKGAIEGSTQVQALERGGKGLAAALKLPSPSKVRDALKSSHPKVTEAIERTAPAVADTLKNSDPAKVRKALREAGPEAVAAAKRFKSQTAKSRPRKADDALAEVAQAVLRRSLPWQWSLLTALLVACPCASGWHVLRAVKRRRARSPALCVEQEIGAWPHGPRQSAASSAPTASDPFIRQA